LLFISIKIYESVVPNDRSLRKVELKQLAKCKQTKVNKSNLLPAWCQIFLISFNILKLHCFLRIAIETSKVMVTLYSMPGSPACRSVLMTAKAIGLDLKIVEVNTLAGETKTPEYLKLNPQHTVPTLVDNDLSIAER